LAISKKFPHGFRLLSQAAMQSVGLALKELKERLPIVIELLEFYLGSKNHAVGLGALEWMIIRHALSHPSSFVHQVLFIIIPNTPYSLFTPQ
jgi:hypothetical protein